MNQYQAQLELGATEKRFSEELIDLINRLILQNPAERLGALGIAEIKQHPWLEEFAWSKLEQKQFIAPFRPYVLSLHASCPSTSTSSSARRPRRTARQRHRSTVSKT